MDAKNWKYVLWTIAYAIGLVLVVLQQVEGNVIYPRVVGRKIGLPGMWVLLAITVGGGLWGIWGCCWACPWPPSFTSCCGRTSAAGKPGCPHPWANRRKKEGGAARCPLCAVQFSAARPAFSCSIWLDWMWISPSVLCSRATNCSGGSFAPSPSQRKTATSTASAKKWA